MRNCDYVGALMAEFAKAVNKYNTFKAHFNLKGLTSYEYSKLLSTAA